MLTIQEIGNKLIEQGNILMGCSESEISQLESYYNIKFPKIYLEFLALMGKGAGRYMSGSSCFFDELTNLKDWANELIVDNGFQPVPNGAFVFWMHQGYQFAFFRLSENDDPKVYGFDEGIKQDDFDVKFDSLTAFFNAFLSSV